MSFQKAQDLLKLAHIAASRHQGVTVKDISTEFSVNERTAQRMLFALKEVYPSLSHKTDSERRRWWTLRETNTLACTREGSARAAATSSSSASSSVTES